MASLEKILAYKQTQPFLTSEDWLQLGVKMGVTQEDVDRAWGKTAEDSFYLTALMYDKVHSIILLEESISQLSKLPTADCILVLKTGEKFFIEIKTTKEATWSISSGRLSRQHELAQILGMTLCYAVLLNGYWGVFTVDQIRANNKLVFPESLNHSIFNQIFDPWLIKIPAGLTINRHYSRAEEYHGLGLPDPNLGSCIKFVVRYGDSSYQITNSADVMAIALVDTVLLDQSLNRLDDTYSVVTQEAKTMLYVYDYNMLLGAVHSTVNSTNGKHFDSSTFISAALDRMSSGQTIAFSEIRTKVLDLFKRMQLSGIPFEILHWSKVTEWKYFEFKP
ncbi:MAG TPA: hypothetical protein VK508_15735 [Cyclobacteriaceae bacterium]|nr:hypothetical protein [Cyclobacteriaceae bacterium]